MIEIYEPDFLNRHEISGAISLQLIVKYNGIGKISVVLPVNDYNKSIIKQGALILDKKHMETFFIANIKIDTVKGMITANGYTANAILNRRVLLSETPVVSVEKDVYKVVSDNLRGLTGVTVGTVKGIPGTVELNTEKGALLDQIVPVLQSAGFGQRMVWDHKSKTHTFEIYEGVDRTPVDENKESRLHSVVFSAERGTAKNLVIVDDMSQFKNAFYISGKLSSGTIITESIGSDIPDAGRREKYISDEMSQDSEVSEAEFRKQMKSKLKEESVKYIRRQTFSAEIDPSDFGKYYGLGDKITCVSTDYGIQFKTRIESYEYTLDRNGEKTKLILGQPIMTIIEEMKLNA